MRPMKLEHNLKNRPKLVYLEDVLTKDEFAKFMKIILHLLGFSCIAGAIFLQWLVFFDIARQGYCIVLEGNPLILSLELVFAAYGACYFGFLFKKATSDMAEKKR